jgi:hypothetical protein
MLFYIQPSLFLYTEVYLITQKHSACQELIASSFKGGGGLEENSRGACKSVQVKFTRWRLWKPPEGLPQRMRLDLSACSSASTAASSAIPKSPSMALPSAPVMTFDLLSCYTPASAVLDGE